VNGGFKIEKWLDSCSTNLKAEAGGFNGNKLKKNDQLVLNKSFNCMEHTGAADFKILPWKANDELGAGLPGKIYFLPGPEWDWLDEESKKTITEKTFAISVNSDRMGYRLQGEALKKKNNEELISSAVCFGTMQLLPDGQLIILMADHQTSGGYPRAGNVISACHANLAQMKAGDLINFEMTDHKIAEELFIKQQRHLHQLETACKLRLENFIHEKNRH
jgi:antagonist of KipI